MQESDWDHGERLSRIAHRPNARNPHLPRDLPLVTGRPSDAERRCSKERAIVWRAGVRVFALVHRADLSICQHVGRSLLPIPQVTGTQGNRHKPHLAPVTLADGAAAATIVLSQRTLGRPSPVAGGQKPARLRCRLRTNSVVDSFDWLRLAVTPREHHLWAS
jgi:hypothetical protein